MPLLILLQDFLKLLELLKSETNWSDFWYVKLALIAGALISVATWVRKQVWDEWIKPKRYNSEQKARLKQRQKFARDMERLVRDIKGDEEWADSQYAELEAHVETDDERRTFSLNPFRWRVRRGLRREKSLTKALKSSRSEIIQLVGEPGSGKSVSLRYVAQRMLERAARARSLNAVIPLYLNLKEMSREPDEEVNQEFVRSFVLRTLKKGNRMGVAKFLDAEFDPGLLDGTWLFLFDSFDEIPEVLSSTEVDEVIKSYAGAIYDFLGGMNGCRGVVASRHFRGPSQSGLPRYTILPLSESRRRQFIKEANLPPAVSRQLNEHLARGDYDLRDLSSNPMLLGVLCGHMEAGNPFPENIHTLFADYIERRFAGVAKLVKSHVKNTFGVDVEVGEVRAVAESAAFCMTADKGMGLSPTRADLERAMLRSGFDFGGKTDALLSALVFIKLARTEDLPTGERSFTFVHRRFQEYFATCVVLREPERIGPRELLTDARWRETAVVICQTQPPGALVSLIEGARAELARFVEDFPGGVDPAVARPEGAAVAEEEQPDALTLPDSFVWPHGSLHILNLLQDGFRRRLKELPDDVRGLIGVMLLTVRRRAGRIDQKSALEVAGAAPPHVLLRLIRDAFKSNSGLLKNIAYRQVARLSQIPDDIADSIRSALFTLVRNGQLGRERLAASAHLARLDKPQRFTSSLRLLLALPHVDLLLHVLVLAAWVSYVRTAGPELVEPRGAQGGLTAFLLTLLLISHLSFRLLRLMQSAVGKGPDVFLVIYARLFAMPIAFIMPTALASQDPFNFPWPYTVACLYALLWLPSALLAARTGQCTGPFWWPLMPLVPPTLLVINLPSILKRMKQHPGVVGLMVAALMLPALPFLVSEKLGAVGAFVVGPVMVLLMFAGVFGVTYTWLRDKVRWHVKARGYVAPMNAQLFRSELGSYRTPGYRRRFVAAVRLRRALEATHEADEVVEGLSLSLERELVERERMSWPQLLRKNTFRSGGIPDPELVDELTLLLEQVRDGRRDRAPRPPAIAPAPAPAPAVETSGI